MKSFVFIFSLVCFQAYSQQLTKAQKIAHLRMVASFPIIHNAAQPLLAMTEPAGDVGAEEPLLAVIKRNPENTQATLCRTVNRKNYCCASKARFVATLLKP